MLEDTTPAFNTLVSTDSEPMLLNNCERIKSNSSSHQGRWTHEEHLQFMEGVSLYGKNWKKVEENVATRTGA